METRWIAEIKDTPTPAEGSLTERALRQTTPVKRTSLRFYALGGLALAMTAPVALILLPKKSAPTPETVKLAFVKAIPTNKKVIPTTAKLNPTDGNRIPTGAKAIPDMAKAQVALQSGHVIFPVVFFRYRDGERPAVGRSAVASPKFRRSRRLRNEALQPDVHRPGREPDVHRPGQQHAESHDLQTADNTFSFRPLHPAVEQTVSEKPVALKLLQDNLPALETVTVQETTSEERLDAGVRSLSPLSVALTPAAAKPMDSLERRLRYPLSPLPNVPQAAVKEVEIVQHADSGQVFGTVALAPETTVRELLVAVFDQYGALRGTTSVTVPAKTESVAIPSFAMPFGTTRYQLGLRPRFERDKSKEMIVGGYVGYEKRVEVPAPPGVTLGDADFYQSNVHKDHFVRFSATLSEKLLNQPFGEPSLTLHGMVTNDKGALLSVASKPIASKPDAQQLDLDFGLLPEVGGYKYTFVVTSQYRLIYVPDASFTVDSAKRESDGSLILTPKPKQLPMAEILKKPELQDYTQIKLTPRVVAALKAKGVTEFVGRTVEANGKSEETLYTGFPAFVVKTVTVENAENITIAPKSGNLPGQPRLK